MLGEDNAVLELLPALLTFAFVSCFTPGPNNMMLTASGATFGFRRTMPHIAGVAVGFPLMVVAVGLGLGTLFVAYPLLHTILKWVGAAYLAWLAWHVATAGRSDGADGRGGRPFTFLQAAAFQWVNPKGWIMAVGALATFTSAGAEAGGRSAGIFGEVLVVALAFAVMGLPSSTSWAAFGTWIGSVLSTERRLRTFNLTMGGLLILSIIPALAA